MSTAETYSNTLRVTFNHLAQQHPELLPIAIVHARRNLSERIRLHYANTIGHGPFKGLKLVEDAHWGSADLGGMILGLYEQEILNELAGLGRKPRSFIDLGAADGYYGLGVLAGELFEKSYCFEITEKGREVIARNTELNGLQDRVTILGEAKPDFFKEIAADDLEDALLLVDVEGAEFDIINAETFKAFAKSTVIIEVHEWYPDIQDKLQRLLQQSAATHVARRFSTGARDLSGFPELKVITDNERWLLCSEGRPYLMSWYRFDPRAG
ncbi:FkbM family methyltransferase [Ferrovibrio terrae]|nr:FkbM family methyltransferase [Ferrovibrio terrae]